MARASDVSFKDYFPLTYKALPHKENHILTKITKVFFAVISVPLAFVLDLLKDAAYIIIRKPIVPPKPKSRWDRVKDFARPVIGTVATVGGSVFAANYVNRNYSQCQSTGNLITAHFIVPAAIQGARFFLGF